MESADEFNHCEWRDDNACDETLTGACGRCTDCRDCNNCPYCEATRLRVDDDYWCWFVGDGTCDDGRYGIFFDCPGFSCDGGDCQTCGDDPAVDFCVLGVDAADARRSCHGGDGCSPDRRSGRGGLNA